jgi:predicted MFS family arabinose efflux permease
MGARRVVLLAIACFGTAVLILPSVQILVLALSVFSVSFIGTWFCNPAQQSIEASISESASGTVMAFNSSALNLAAVISPVIGGLVFANGGFRLLGTWTAVVAVAAWVAAYALLPKPQVVPREPAEGIGAEECVAECAPV